MVRGLKYCASYNCCSHRYKDRDDVGCFNIYRKTRIDFPDVSLAGKRCQKFMN
jgi:hypothetical protein